jgi:3-methyladenine DNA glycosylase/8-oxoguanine DNA glycosylase
MGQQVAFNIGRNIRKQLYEMCGNPIKREAILNADLTKIKNLTIERANLLKEMAKIDDTCEVKIVLESYSNLKGFGVWSHDAVSILLDISDTINLSTDSYICKNLAIYLNKPITKKSCHDYISIAENYQTIVCYFLWRIKNTSVHKLAKNEELIGDDFI